MQGSYSDYLAHHGVKGQKWGVRRYQNDDGTLTAAGKERYGDSKDYGDEGFVKKFLGGERGFYAMAKQVQKGWDKAYAKAEAKGNTKKAERIAVKREAQAAANANLDRLRRSRSTGKQVAMNLLIGSPSFDHARARGESVLSSYVEAGLGMTGVGTVLRMYRDKKAYGYAIVWSGMNGESL